MLKNLKIVISLFVLCGLLSISGHALGQEAEKPAASSQGLRIAIIDLVAIRRQASAVQDVNKQMGAFNKSFQDEVKKEEDALRAANQELAKKRAILAPEAFAQERRNFEQKVVDVQRKVQEHKRALGKSRSDAMVVVENELNKIIEGIAKENNLHLVLRRDLTILVSHRLDITAEVLKRLDAALPNVKVAAPGQ